MGDETNLETKIKEILGELAGAASMCWIDRPAGVFDSVQAQSFVQEAVNKIIAINNRKEIIAAKIIGLQEAMRPLLEEWSKLEKDEK